MQIVLLKTPAIGYWPAGLYFPTVRNWGVAK